MQAQLRQLAIIDELTGLNNRRGLTTLAEHQLKVARRRSMPAAVLFIDLDDMKGTNDTYGHAEGDRALTDTADLLRATFRTSDLLARVGGDEFCVFLPDCDPPTATVVSERLRDAVRAHNETADRPFALSLSVGVAEYDPAVETAIDALIERADRAMYREKSARSARSTSTS
jgi:diguanylate cyclase (GGDEF)-like protein